MKLRKIKLSGFKSFVDPTTIQLQSNLTGVVGPNGCGKSNLIDAVRWVMGEISAKQLRGESMSDVIFNGSSSRQPVGQALAELVFDNSDASLGGEYASYGEIAIRREVNREGSSDYFLNNVNCRRKDIIDIFLGTGLGHNSYAVIEQGMISRFVEAKPEELRVFIEEAAGISKYKERRRETETRIKHTKENLFRLNDILEEVNKQLKYLKSQANAAERYRKLKQEERLAKAELHTLHWRELNRQLQAEEALIKSEETKLENGITELHVVQAKIVALREKYASDLESFNQVQANYYHIGANIARLEQQIKHRKERREELTKNLTEASQVWQETVAHSAADQNQLELLKAEKIEIDSGLLIEQELLAKAKQELQVSEAARQLWQKNWERFSATNAETLQLLEVGQTHVKHLEPRIIEETQSLEKLKSELASLDFVKLNTEIEKLDNLFTELKNNHSKFHEDTIFKQQQILAERDASSALASTLDQTRHRLQTLIGRKSSLEALQQASLGKNDLALADWLTQQNLGQNLRLAQELQVVAGWETAVETVLGVYLEAVCVDGIASVMPAIKNLSHGNLILFDKASSVAGSSKHGVTTLISKITSKLSLESLLYGVYVAEDLAEAWELQPKLDHDESVITKAGIWMGASWLRVAYATNPRIGILQREKELQELEHKIIEERQRATNQEQELKERQNVLAMLEEQHQKLQQELHTLVTGYSDTKSQVAAKVAYVQHLKERAQILKAEITSKSEVLVGLNQQLSTAQVQQEEEAKKNEANKIWRDALLQDRGLSEGQLEVARHNIEETSHRVANSTMRQQLLQTQISYLAESLDRAQRRLSSLKEQQSGIEQALAETAAPIVDWEQELQLDLKQRLLVESDLALAKQKAVEVEEELRELEQKHVKQQKLNEEVRGLLEQKRTLRQGLQVRGNTYIEQVAELELQLDTLNAALSDAVTITEWEEKLMHLASRIERLGLINLAAIEEFEKLSERKDYLTAQNQDLVSALNTLEDVMRRIDHDTKERFHEAYTNINHKFQELFPKVFNGGTAYLEQSGDNLLDTGVLIMARPPGKRNSSIHLLSGGEKALTAIALIFSIFHLNPAPFCILDEVDAPLDDANVWCFCNLVKEMAKTIQFIFITHNKLTMEIADQLVGVTMQEAGVSRIVTVDIDTAVSLADKNT